MTDGYPLAALLALRRRDEDAARAALAGAVAAEDRARRVREALRAAQEAAERRPLAGGAEGVLTAAALQGAADHAQRLRHEEAAASAALATARHGVEAARAALAATSAATEAIARHRAAWEETGRRARERAEEAAQDELAAARLPRGGEG